ncbi:MAG: recombinase RecT, partial [Bombilactobacillus sp.]|nr:recombinase RecT [Bombilactobacillus sp.]
QNGFEKTVYWTREQIDQHRQKFSKMSDKQKPTGVWATEFDAMALKTVLRNLIGKWGPMTVDMQTAYNADEEVADTSPIDEETKDVTPQEPATDITQLIGGETNDNSDQKPADKPASKANGQTTTAVQEIQQEDFPF